MRRGKNAAAKFFPQLAGGSSSESSRSSHCFAPRTFSPPGLASRRRRRRCSLTSSPFRSPRLGRRSLTTKLADIRRTRGSLRFMANCFIIFDIFPVYGCGRAFCLRHCLLCVMNATLCATLLRAPRSFFRSNARLETCLSSNNDTRTDLLILSPSPFQTISAIYTDSANNFASNGSTTR